jgi:hypothetical protein
MYLTKRHRAACPIARVVFLSEASLGQAIPQPGGRALADSSVRRILAEPRFPEDVVVDVLLQRSRPQSQAKRDELADSIVARAIRAMAPPNPAVAAVAAAGRASGRKDGGTPDSRALQWLIRIHQESRDHETRLHAILEMTNQESPGRAMGYLREVAIRPDERTASAALNGLIVLAVDTTLGTSPGERQQAAAHLRAMWDGRLVTNGLALVDLRRFATNRRWPPRT